MKYDNQFVNILEDNVRQRGEMDKLISDSAKLEILLRVKYMFMALFVDD